MTKAPKDPPTFHRLTVDVEPDLFRKLKVEADKNERSASKQAKIIIKDHLNGNAGQKK